MKGAEVREKMKACGREGGKEEERKGELGDGGRKERKKVESKEGERKEAHIRQGLVSMCSQRDSVPTKSPRNRILLVLF